MAEHARLSPSSAHRWLRCPGSLALEERLGERGTSAYAEEGTAAHWLFEQALTGASPLCEPYVGRTASNGVEITPDMAENVQISVDRVLQTVEMHELLNRKVELHVENQVDLSDVMGLPDQFGTADVILLAHAPNGQTLLEVHDLKYGYKVVHAEENEQLMTYALGALEQYGLAYDIVGVTLVIHQPRQDHHDEWSVSIAELREFQAKLKFGALKTLKIADGGAPGDHIPLVPGKKQCEWCAAKATCPALTQFVQDETRIGFDNLDAAPDVKEEAALEFMSELELKLKAVPLIEMWCEAQREEMARRLFAGEESTEFKIVEGRRGNRAWRNPLQVEELMKSMRLTKDEMYDFKLISPTTAEKRLAKDHPRRWAKVQDLIHQPEGKPSVVPRSDKRPAITLSAPTADGFSNVTSAEE